MFLVNLAWHQNFRPRHFTCETFSTDVGRRVVFQIGVYSGLRRTVSWCVEAILRANWDALPPAPAQVNDPTSRLGNTHRATQVYRPLQEAMSAQMERANRWFQKSSDGTWTAAIIGVGALTMKMQEAIPAGGRERA